MTQRLTGIGLWSAGLRYGDRAASAEAAAELDELGYTALWIPDVGGDVFAAVRNLLTTTTTLTIATGILNLWMHEPDETAAQHAVLTQEHGDRFLVGIGVSHQPLIDMAEAGKYRKPLTRMREYLDGLDAAPTPLAPRDRVLAALGPKMLELARDRTAGVHPYLVTPEHTAVAREAVGPDRLVAPEQAVVLSTDATRARELARAHLAGYLALPNYANNWKRFGFTDDDIADGGSDRLVDALVAWGDDAAILARIDEHRAAGADHVCVQVLSDQPTDLPVEQWRELAAALVQR
ncbi:MAG: LLM class F420-dependent oxidoreductase [Actinomycetota bacterium]|nr:LLM class F420-dependent oxidoreductase [Actinomycetota bacterium]